MAGRLPLPEVVVVHGRQIVMDQRVRVDEFDGGSRGQHVFGAATERLGRREREHRTEPLAAGQQRVAHRLDEAFRAIGVHPFLMIGRKEVQTLECGLNEAAQVVRIRRGGLQSGNDARHRTDRRCGGFVHRADTAPRRHRTRGMWRGAHPDG